MTTNQRIWAVSRKQLAAAVSSLGYPEEFADRLKYIMRSKVNQEENPENEHLQNVHNMALFAGGISFIIAGAAGGCPTRLGRERRLQNEI